MIDYANAVRSIRAATGLSQKDFAAAIDASQTAVSYWESGKREPCKAQLDKIAAVFGMNPQIQEPHKSESVLALIAICDTLTPSAHEKLLDYARMLARLPEYKRDCT